MPLAGLLAQSHESVRRTFLPYAAYLPGKHGAAVRAILAWLESAHSCTLLRQSQNGDRFQPRYRRRNRDSIFAIEVCGSGTNFPHHQWCWFGLTMGLAAMVGDAVKSFFKRRIGIAPGLPWIPADQLDFVFAGILVLSLWVPLAWLDAF